MARIHKISGYLIDRNGRCDTEDIEKYISDLKYCRISPRHLHVETQEIGDWEDSNPLKYGNCDLAECEKYFKKEPTTFTDRKPVVGATYKHFKTGKLVKVLAISQDTENVGTFYVVYENLSDHSIWNRPYDMFVSEVDHEKYPDAQQKYRFERIEV